MNREDKRLLRTLERFAQSDEQSITGWRCEAPDFFPENFWNRKIRQVPEGVRMSGPAPQLPDVRMWWAWRSVLIQAWRTRFPLSDLVRLLVAPVVQEAGDALSSMSEWPYQRAVLLMVREPWRARHCMLCGKPFAAEKGASKFCSVACFAESRLDTKRRWWTEQGSERRRQSQSRAKREGRKLA
jgi:hypothetical protein